MVVSNSCKYFLHELGKSSLEQNAMNCQLIRVLKFSAWHYLDLNSQLLVGEQRTCPLMQYDWNPVSRGSAGWIQIKYKILFKAKVLDHSTMGCGKNSEIPQKFVEAKRKSRFRGCGDKNFSQPNKRRVNLSFIRSRPAFSGAGVS
jgi:hypothetical protein